MMNASAGENSHIGPFARTAYAALSEPGTEQDMKGPCATFTGQYSSAEPGHRATGYLGLPLPHPLANALSSVNAHPSSQG